MPWAPSVKMAPNTPEKSTAGQLVDDGNSQLLNDGNQVNNRSIAPPSPGRAQQCPPPRLGNLHPPDLDHNYSLRQLLANAAIAASRVGS